MKKGSSTLKHLWMLFPITKWTYFQLAILGVINSLWATFLIILLNRYVSSDNPDDNYQSMAIYMMLFIASLFTSRYFQLMMIRLTSDSSFGFQSKIFQHLRYAGLQEFERLERERIYTALGDARLITTFPGYFVELFNAFTYVICGLVFIFYTSFISGVVMILLMVLLGFRYLLVQNNIRRELLNLRTLEDNYYRYIMDFIYGFTQFKMSTRRTNSFFNDFLDLNRRTAKVLNDKMLAMELNNNLIGYYSWYFILGFVAFVVPIYADIPRSSLMGYVTAVLFIMTPLIMLVKLLPLYTKIRFSLERLDHFMNDIGSIERADSDQQSKPEAFESLRLENVEFSYKSYDGTDGFTIGPLNLEIQKGSIVFLTGNNGSGKSTLVKVMTGLYKPTAGSVYLNDVLIESHNIQQFRSAFGCVFSDHHLFRDNYDNVDFSRSNKELHSLFELFKMDQVCSQAESLLELKLSKGQERRCALIYAILEQRDVLMLDEWAADQDPGFRHYFYTALLPEMRSRGKTIIAITHDDGYFDCADKILRFNDGSLSDVTEKILKSNLESRTLK